MSWTQDGRTLEGGGTHGDDPRCLALRQAVEVEVQEPDEEPQGLEVDGREQGYEELEDLLPLPEVVDA